MALLSDLVRIVAAVEGLEEVSVGIFARHARESGHISQGGRGRSAAKMSVKDAANLIIAVNGCALAKDVDQNLVNIRRLPLAEAEGQNIIGLAEKGATFGNDLETLLSFFVAKSAKITLGYRSEQATVVFHRPFAKAEIKLFSFLDGMPITQKIVYRSHLEEEELSGPDRVDETSITQRTLLALAKALTD